MGGDIRILEPGVTDLQSGQHSIIVLNQEKLENEELNFDASETDLKQNLADWRAFFENAGANKPFDPENTRWGYWLAFVNTVGFIELPDGSLTAYDSANPDHLDIMSKPTFLRDAIHAQIEAEGIAVNSVEYYNREDEVTYEYIHRLSQSLNATTALALSAVLQKARQDCSNNLDWYMGMYRERMAEVISEQTDGMLTNEEVLKRIDAVPLQIYDYISALVKDPNANDPHFIGYYVRPSTYNNSHSFYASNATNAQNASYLTPIVLIHEVAGHGISGVMPLLNEAGEYISRHSSGGYMFIERPDAVTRVWREYIGSWLNEAMAGLAVVETTDDYNRDGFNPSLGNPLEISLLLSLMMGSTGSSEFDTSNVVKDYILKKDLPEVIEAQKAFSSYYYASRSTDGPKGFSRADFPFEDTCVTVRKDIVRVIDGNFGPGFFNRISLAVAKAEYFNDGDGDGGHASNFSVSANVIRAVVAALHADNTGSSLVISNNSETDNTLRLPWLHQEKTPRDSAIQSDVYKTYAKKWPSTYAVLNAILQAPDKQATEDALSQIMGDNAIPITITF